MIIHKSHSKKEIIKIFRSIEVLYLTKKANKGSMYISVSSYKFDKYWITVSFILLVAFGSIGILYNISYI